MYQGVNSSNEGLSFMSLHANKIRRWTFMLVVSMGMFMVVLYLAYMKTVTVAGDIYTIMVDRLEIDNNELLLSYRPNDTNNIRSIFSQDNLTEPNDFGQIPHSKIFVRDIFVDHRYNPARIAVLALAPVKRPKIYCHTMHEDGKRVVTKESDFIRKDGVVPPFCHFKSYLIHCQFKTIKRDPHRIGLSVRQVTKDLHIQKPLIIRKTGNPKTDLGMCLPKIFGMDDFDAEQFIEFMELNKILGIKHAVLYDVENSTQRMTDVVKYYKQMGFLSIIPWRLPVPNLDKHLYRSGLYRTPPGTEPGVRDSAHHPYCVRRHAQLLSNFHCHLTSIHRFEYLAFPDLDEVFVPRKHRTLPELLEHLEKDKKFQDFASIVFKEAYFCIDEDEDKSALSNTTTLTLFSNVRTPVDNFSEKLKSPKSIIRPERTALMTIHYVDVSMKKYERRFFLPDHLGTKNHYRVPNFCKKNSKTLVDNVLNPYLQKLENNVDFVRKKVFGKT